MYVKFAMTEVIKTTCPNCEYKSLKQTTNGKLIVPTDKVVPLKSELATFPTSITFNFPLVPSVRARTLFGELLTG